MKTKTLKYIFGISISVLLTLTVFVSISSASKGSELLDIEQKISVLENENSKLTDNIVKNSSLKNIEDQSSKLGFKEPGEVVYLKNTALANLSQ